MTHHGPSSLKVLITVAVGNLFGRVYQTAVNSLNLEGSERVPDFGSGAGTPARLIARKLVLGSRSYVHESLNVIAQEEIRGLMQQSGLTEFRASVGNIPLMGNTYEGILVKKEQDHA